MFTSASDFLSTAASDWFVLPQVTSDPCQVLPGFSGQDACEADVLECLADVGNSCSFDSVAQPAHCCF